MSSKYLAAYALASLANPNPTAADVEKICKAVNVTVDKATLDFVLESVNGRDVATLVNEGVAKMSAMAASAGPVSGGAAAAAGGAAAPAAAAAKQEEPEEEGDDDMGFGLFD